VPDIGYVEVDGEHGERARWRVVHDAPRLFAQLYLAHVQALHAVQTACHWGGEAETMTRLAGTQGMGPEDNNVVTTCLPT